MVSEIERGRKVPTSSCSTAHLRARQEPRPTRQSEAAQALSARRGTEARDPSVAPRISAGAAQRRVRVMKTTSGPAWMPEVWPHVPAAASTRGRDRDPGVRSTGASTSYATATASTTRELHAQLSQPGKRTAPIPRARLGMSAARPEASMNPKSLSPRSCGRRSHANYLEACLTGLSGNRAYRAAMPTHDPLPPKERVRRVARLRARPRLAYAVGKVSRFFGWGIRRQRSKVAPGVVASA